MIDSQEYVLGEVYKEMGLTEEELLEHWTGIAFLVSYSLKSYSHV